jgi:O-antigen/teichoic acid export membrane protein
VEAYVIGSLSVQTIVVVSLSVRLGLEWPRRADHKQVLSFGMRQHAGAVTARALKRLDGYVLWYFMGSAAVGVYSVAASLAELLLLLPRAIHATLISYVSTNSYDVALRGTRQLLQTSARALIVATTCFALFGYMIIPAVFGAQFDLARSPFVILTFATAFLGLYVIGGAFVIGSNRPHVTSLIMMCSAALNVVLSLLLIPRYGLVGNAAATCVASSVAALMILWQVARPLPARATSEARA